MRRRVRRESKVRWREFTSMLTKCAFRHSSGAWIGMRNLNGRPPQQLGKIRANKHAAAHRSNHDDQPNTGALAKGQNLLNQKRLQLGLPRVG